MYGGAVVVWAFCGCIRHPESITISHILSNSNIIDDEAMDIDQTHPNIDDIIGWMNNALSDTEYLS